MVAVTDDGLGVGNAAQVACHRTGVWPVNRVGRRRPCPNKGTRPPPAPRRPGSPTRQTRSRAPDPSAGVENSCCRTWACYGPAAAGAPGNRRGGFQARLFSDSECPPPRMGEDSESPECVRRPARRNLGRSSASALVVGAERLLQEERGVGSGSSSRCGASHRRPRPDRRPPPSDDCRSLSDHRRPPFGLRSDDCEPPSDGTLLSTAARPRHRPNRRPTEC